MFKSVTKKLAKALGEDTLLPVPSLDQADCCRPMFVVIKKNRRWFWRSPKYIPSEYSLHRLLLDDSPLNVNITNEDLTDFNDVSSFEVTGKVGAKIASEVDLEVSACDKIQMSAKLGQIVKNKVNIPMLQDMLMNKRLNLAHPFIEEVRQNHRNVLCVVVGSLSTTKDSLLITKIQHDGDEDLDVNVPSMTGEEDLSIVDDRMRIVRIPAGKPVSYNICELQITVEGAIRLLILGEGTGGFDKPEDEKYVDITVGGNDETDGGNPFVDNTPINPFDEPSDPTHYELFRPICDLDYSERYWLTHWLHSLLSHPAMIDALESLIGQAHGLITNNEYRECPETFISRHLEGRVPSWKTFFQKMKFRFEKEKVHYPKDDDDGFLMAVHCALAAMSELSDEQCEALSGYHGECYNSLLHLIQETAKSGFCPTIDDPLIWELFCIDSPARVFAESLDYHVVKLTSGEEMLELRNQDMVVLEGALRTLYVMWGK